MLSKRISLLSNCLVFLLFSSVAFAEQFVEGQHYEVIQTAATAKLQDDAVVVEEFFSYVCPACASLEPSIKEWLDTELGNMVFTKVPVVFQPAWELYAKAYLVAKAFKLDEQMSHGLFAISQQGGDQQAIYKLFIEQGLDEQTVERAFNHSAAIDDQLETGMRQLYEYQLMSVPSFVIAGQYKTNVQLAGGTTQLFKVINYLVEKASKDQV